ncbi:hypothetical protein AX14_005353 [Amanita brunnescens Koide BX004]|nr:hypothetical protein AX14_005353 [Amanita brunnescens Koide BX004]
MVIARRQGCVAPWAAIAVQIINAVALVNGAAHQVIAVPIMRTAVIALDVVTSPRTVAKVEPVVLTVTTACEQRVARLVAVLMGNSASVRLKM